MGSSPDAGPRRRRPTPTAIAVGVLGVLLFVLSVALVVTSVTAAQRTSARADYALTTESEAANLVFTQREVGNLSTQANAYLGGNATRREVQIARALLERRLTVQSEFGPNPAADDAELRKGLAAFDAAFADAPTGTLPADQRDEWASRLKESTEAFDVRGKQLVLEYQQEAADRSRQLAQAEANEQRARTLLIIATILTALALFAGVGRLMVLRNRESRRVLAAEAASLAQARAALGRAKQQQEDQSRVLESIAKGADLGTIFTLVTRLASLAAPGATAVIADGTTVLSQFPSGPLPTEEPSSDPMLRWSQSFEDLSGDERHRRSGSLRIYAPADLDEIGREEALACADLLRIAVERERTSRALVRQARHDALTGLPNRATLLDRIQDMLDSRRAAARRGRTQDDMAVLFVDLDRFKDVNDSMGHEAGDQLLIQVVGRLQRSIRGDDQVFRLAGDEFVVLCPHLPNAALAGKLADRLIIELSEPFQINRTPVWVGASIGIAMVEDTSTAPDLLREADLAMYRAKQDGRSRWQVYDEALASEASSRLHLSKALRAAVEREELRLFYQPVVDMTDGSVRGYEALVRWERPDHGLMGPGHFLEMAEETRDILAIGRWVVAEAARRFATWRAAGLPDDVYMAVNVAAQQLKDPTFVSDVMAILADTGVPPASLLVELTEHTLVDGDHVAGALTRFRRAGVRLALDDFGTGYSSLTQLESLPVDVVKVDRQFVVRLGDGGDRHEAFLAALVKLVEALDLGLIVEGVETEDERRALLHAGFRTAQGYLFGRPSPDPALPGAAGGVAASAR